MRASAPDLPDGLARHVSPATQYYEIPGTLDLQRGGRLSKVKVAYQTWGRPENDGRTILVCHALTGSADVEAWWPGVIGRGAAFDPDHDYIICSNILGSCYGTTGPVSPMPNGTGRYRSRFPRITVRDMVDTQKLLLDHLGIEYVELITGPSLGGMQVLEWALSYPDRVGSIVPIGVGGRHSPWCIGMSEAQRAAIYADPNWQGGNYDESCAPHSGLAAARMMAVCGYRSWSSFESRFARERRSDDVFQVQSYLRHQGKKINGRFDANTYVRLTQAMNDHDISEGRGTYEATIASIAHPAMVVSVSSDILYPPEEQRVLADHMPNARYEMLDSIHGHDGFLIESAELGRLIRDFRHWTTARDRAAPDLQLVSSTRQ